MRGLLIFFWILLHSSFTGGRDLRESTYSRGRGNVGEKDVLQRLLLFYRSQKDTFSKEAPESLEIQTPPKPHTFRMDFSSGISRDDYVPFPDDIPLLPFGSYELPNSKPSEESVINEVVLLLTTAPPVTNDTEIETMGSESSVEVQDDLTTTDKSKELVTSSTINPLSLGAEVIPYLQHDDPYEDEEDPDQESEECREGETKKLRCNNACVCVDGAFFCSKRKCGGSGGGTNGTGILANSTTNNGKKDWGNRKKVWDMSSSCSSGQTKSVDCNQCVCAMGQWSCTKGGCIALTFREKASYSDGVSLYNQVATLTENKHLDEDCAEGNTRQLDCNQCVCHLNSWSCSSFPCGTTPLPPKAKEIHEACQVEGTVKERGCKVCNCRNGLWLCVDTHCKGREDADQMSVFTIPSKIRQL